jgi:3-hydroxyacyl-CoA dehydrogenase/enoyl-CoA hydratase/3-hydroxybutyryl-CoA epimerase
MGVKNFVALAQSLAMKYGKRFTPNALLIEMAKNGETFYGRFGQSAKAKAAA